jgi:hypothetical protein
MIDPTSASHSCDKEQARHYVYSFTSLSHAHQLKVYIFRAKIIIQAPSIPNTFSQSYEAMVHEDWGYITELWVEHCRHRTIDEDFSGVPQEPELFFALFSVSKIVVIPG